MKTHPLIVKKPVQRNRAELHLLTTLFCFGLSVSVTRLFLELTGYPQIGNSELHIAHVLWGGLLLFLAVLVLLVFANPWAYSLGAVLGGAGMGLFIDEVGKFITQSNDYFYPWAAPIIYVFFLLTVLVYLQVNRKRQHDARTEMYHSLDLLSEVLDHDLEPGEHADLIRHLEMVQKNTENPDLLRLSEQLLAFARHEELHLAPEKPDFRERIGIWYRALEERWLSQKSLKWILLVAIGILGVFSLLQLGIVIGVLQSPEIFSENLLQLLNAGQIRSAQGANWFVAYAVITIAIGLLQLGAAILILIGREENGVSIGYFTLLFELVAANLLAFYFDQFSTIFLAMIQLILMLGFMSYRRRFLDMQAGG